MIVYYVVGLVAVGFVYVANAKPLAFRVNPAGAADSVSLFSRGRRAAGRVPIFILSVLLIAFASLRYGIGSDYFLYTSLYEQIDPHSLSNSLQDVPQEFGWVFLGFLLRSFTDSPYLILGIASALTVIPVLVAIRRRSQDPVFGLFLYYFLGYYAVTFNAVRQSIAVAFMMLGESYKSESRTKWVLFSGIGAVFHSSALVAFVIQLVVSRWRPSWLSVTIALSFSGALSLFVLNSSFIGTLAGELNPRYETYLEGQGAGVGTWLIFFLRVVMIVACLRLPRSKEDDTWLAYVCVSAIVLILGTTYVVVARFEPYFGIYSVLLIPNMMVKQRTMNLGVLKLGLGVVALIYFGFYAVSYNQIVPYEVVPELSQML